MKNKLPALCDEFPRLFPHSEQQTDYGTHCFDFECGPGWYELLRTLCRDLETMAVEDRRDEEEWPCAAQIKEKFAGLRFYAYNLSPTMRNRVEQAEEQSYSVCESCGIPGQLYRLDGYYIVRCEVCAQREKRHKQARYGESECNLELVPE